MPKTIAHAPIASRARRLAGVAALTTIPVLAAGLRLAAQTPAGQSFTTLAPGYTQELVATVDVGTFPPPNHAIAKVLGGVAFAPDGDVWAAECVFQGTTLHRFDTGGTQTFAPALHGTTSRRAEVMTVALAGPNGEGPGCGLTNHPDGSLYSNSTHGIYKLDAETGAILAGPMGAAGNALGLAVDPVTNHIVYAGADCHQALVPGAPACTLWDLDPAGGGVTPYAMLPHIDVPFVDGLYFSPSGSHLFVTNRIDEEVETSQGTVELNQLTVVTRPTGLVTEPSTAQIAQHLPMLGEPDGVSFHAVEGFVVTNDEAGGTMTRFDFPGGDYSQPPTASTPIQPVDGAGDPVGDPINVYGAIFAAGGHRGDLTQVGPDGCIYATQGRNFLSTDLGTRYDDGTETVEDSIVRICGTNGGFNPPPGVGRDSQQGSIAGSVYLDMNGNHTIDVSDQFLAGVTVTLAGSASQTAPSSGGPVPAYQFDALNPGSYTVSVPSTFDGYALSASTPASVPATVNDAGDPVTGIDFLYEPAQLDGSVYLDSNDDGVIGPGDTFLGAVPLALSGASSASTQSAGVGPAPTYAFSQLKAGSYSVHAPAVFDGYGLAASTSTPQNRTLSASGHVSNVDFLYLRARLSGFAYVDANGNNAKDPGEAGLGGVTITVPGVGSATTAADGSYRFTGLAAGTLTVNASSPAGGYVIATANPLAPIVPAGGDVTDVNFGYRPGGLSGFAYIDFNRNGVRDAGEPGLPNVTIMLAGGGTAVTNGTGAYAFNGLTAGNYSVAAPPTAFGYTLHTLNPLPVPLTAGQYSPDNNFGYKDITKPVCAVYGSANPPYMTFQDAASGIVRLDIVKNLNTNFLVTVTPSPTVIIPAMANPSAMPTGTKVDFAPATTAQLRTYAQRINTSLSAQLIVMATDAFGNTVSCDPVETTVTRLRHDRGVQTFTDIPFAEHFVTIENGTPGLRGLDVVVNGVVFRVRGLDDGEVKRVNVRTAMVRGNQNTITLIPRGRPGESADVTIAARE